MSASSSPQPAAPEAVLRQAGDLGRRHGRAAVYWQIGDNGTAAGRQQNRRVNMVVSGDAIGVQTSQPQ